MPSPWGPGQPSAPGGEAGSSLCPGGRDPHVGAPLGLLLGWSPPPSPPSKGQVCSFIPWVPADGFNRADVCPSRSQMRKPSNMTFVRSRLRAEQFCADRSSRTQLGPGGSELPERYTLCDALSTGKRLPPLPAPEHLLWDWRSASGPETADGGSVSDLTSICECLVREITF